MSGKKIIPDLKNSKNPDSDQNVPAKKERLNEDASSTDQCESKKKSDISSSNSSSYKGSSAPMALRKFKKTPVYIVEYHNEVLGFLFDCVRSRFMPCLGNTLIHFDSHPDMVIPRGLSAEQAYDKISLLNKCDIESWIMPLCYTGIITRIVWIKQPCCQQIPLGKHNFNIGTYKDKIYVDFAIPYFLSEATLCATSQLSKKRSIELLVVNDFELDGNDKKSSQQHTTLNLFAQANEPYILDIDLDFFCTKNPFLNLYTRCDYYDDLSRIFALDNEDLNEQNATEMNKRRLKTLKTLKKIFKHLHENESKITGCENVATKLEAHKLTLIKSLIKKLLAHYKPQEIDWMEIYDAGCTADSGGLPAFTATTADLEATCKRFRNIIHHLPHDPIFVTISRSSEDEYCPSAQVEEIQEMTIRELEGKLKLHKPIRADNNEDYSVMKL